MITPTELRKGKQTFRPRARLVSVLGDQLIRDATVGLLELVKNGYDASANRVVVRLLNLSKPEDTVIVVEDNGDGMDLDTVLYKWLEPATGNKEESKRRHERNRAGRLPLGEKGVGRFAAHKLGHHLTLISRARNDNGTLLNVEVVVKINWDQFDDASAYLSDVPIEYEERSPQQFLDNSGTYMEMSHARMAWQKNDVARVSRALRRLMSPIRTPESFIVALECPDHPQFEDLDATELLKTCHAQMSVLVDEYGDAEFDYSFNLPPYPPRDLFSMKKDLRQGNENWQPSNRKSRCGSFFITLYIWDRDPNSLQLSRTSREDLNQMNGIAVFRDGIRVMPYGEPDDDWLEMDKDRYMSTSEAVSRRNVVGTVEIDQIDNRELRDKSNREGFIENEAFQDFYLLMRGVIQIATNEFRFDRARMRTAEKDKKKPLIPAVKRLEQSAGKVSEPLNEVRQIIDNSVRQGKVPQEVAEQLITSFSNSTQTLAVVVNETKQAAFDTIATLDEERDVLLRLAGLGLAAERFTHEFARLTREASDILNRIVKLLYPQHLVQVKAQVEALRVILEALRDLVLALGPMFYIRRRSNEKEIDVKTVVEHALLLNQGQIEEYKIQVDVTEPEGNLLITMRTGALTQVFNNLIDNACYWLSRKAPGNERYLKITILAEQRAVVITDNGPGIDPRDQHRVFDVFFSTKVDGRGLGLFITREVLAEAKATIELIEAGETPETFPGGTAFKIQFPNKD